MATPDIEINKITERPCIIIVSDLDADYAYIVALELQKELASDTEKKTNKENAKPLSRNPSKKDLKRNVSFKDTVETYVITPVSLEKQLEPCVDRKIGEAFAFTF